MQIDIGPACVYTIATPDRIIDAAKNGTLLPEFKRWVRAKELFDEASENGQVLPILFANSRAVAGLIGWSVLRSIKVTAVETHYSIGELWGVPRSRPQDLQLLDSDAHIAEGHIRPYVLCKTPSFLVREAARPRQFKATASLRMAAREGQRRLVAHMRIERVAALSRALKKQRMEQYEGRLPCEVCGFDFLEAYGPLGAGFAEAHHISSLWVAPRRGQQTTLDDLAVVCPNCHRMLHRGPDFVSMESLRGRLRHARNKAGGRR